MSKALFINLFGEGHINPTVGLVKELINRGEQVTYIAAEEFKQKIEKTGAKFIGHKNLSILMNDNLNLENSEQPFPPEAIGILKELKEMIEEITETVINSEEKFDYIIYDPFFILGNEIGRVLKIPTICSISTFAMNEKTNILSSQSQSQSKESMMQKLQNNSEYIKFVNDLQEKYGIKCPSILNAFLGKGMINIVYTSKYFQFHSESFDDSYKFIGPSIVDRNEDMSFSLETNDKKKVIYISLGTIFNNSIEFYESCFKAFDNMDVKVIMSVGENTDINTFKFIPSNFIVRNHVSQLEVLKHTDVFITHGGMNSTSEGLYYDVPLILIPQSADQPAVANRVAELGAGIAIRKDKVTPELLKQSVANILSDNNFKINSGKIGKSLREAGGYKKGVDEILNLNGLFEKVASGNEK